MKAVLACTLLMVLSLPVRTNERTVWPHSNEQKIFIITLDGFRWQEVFSGADSLLLFNPAYTTNNGNAADLYWASTPDERRKKLMPFFWNVIARQGQLIGNRTKGSRMNVSNPYALSYPGYNELLTGEVDYTIFNNGKTPNRNLSLLEELNSTSTYRNKVAAFASWDAFPFILNKAQSSFFINSGFDELLNGNKTDALINRLQAETEDQKNVRYDELTYLACREYLLKQKPSVVFLGFGGTDEAAHKKEYTAYLQQAANADRMIGELWQTVQNLPEYRDKTTFLITTDHGRGAAANDWNTHGILVSGSSQTWMAMMGPSVAASGEQSGGKQHYLKNVKSLVLRLLSEEKQ